MEYCTIIIRLGINVALTHQIRSYRDSETKENVETQKRKQRGETTGIGQRQLKIHKLKKGRNR